MRIFLVTFILLFTISNFSSATTLNNWDHFSKLPEIINKTEKPARIYLYPEIIEQEVKLSLLQRSAFVVIDLGIASVWALLAGMASSWDYTIMTSTFLADASLGFLAIPVYSSGVIETIGLYKKKKDLQGLANLEGGRYIHVYTGGPKEYNHLFGFPYIAKWMNTRSLVFVSGSKNLSESVSTFNKELIPIFDPEKSTIQLTLKIHDEDSGLTKVNMPLIDVLRGYTIPAEVQVEWAEAVENSNYNKKLESNFTIEAELFLENGNKKTLGRVADDLMVKKILVLTKSMKFKKWFYEISKKYVRITAVEPLSEFLNYKPIIKAKRKRINNSKNTIRRILNHCDAFLGRSFVKEKY
ncbi:MAG: hypothetical protein KDD58_01480 [Bdellovibrionales bacterium]|nr:hypothetical protein [Bdellovibrionales bacterium]